MREIWLRLQLWAFRRLNPRLQAKVARNDVGDALGVRALYLHESGRRDSMACSLVEPRGGSDAAIIISVRRDLQEWVEAVERGALHTVRG